MANAVINAADKFDLRPLDPETIEHFLMCHPKYLSNPLTDSEKALIRDICRVVCPLTRLRPHPLFGIGG
jgi:hypothetical protein